LQKEFICGHGASAQSCWVWKNALTLEESFWAWLLVVFSFAAVSFANFPMR
jgi:hypothetical protein